MCGMQHASRAAALSRVGRAAATGPRRWGRRGVVAQRSGGRDRGARAGCGGRHARSAGVAAAHAGYRGECRRGRTRFCAVRPGLRSLTWHAACACAPSCQVAALNKFHLKLESARQHHKRLQWLHVRSAHLCTPTAHLYFKLSHLLATLQALRTPRWKKQLSVYTSWQHAGRRAMVKIQTQTCGASQGPCAACVGHGSGRAGPPCAAGPAAHGRAARRRRGGAPAAARGRRPGAAGRAAAGRRRPAAPAGGARAGPGAKTALAWGRPPLWLLRPSLCRVRQQHGLAYAAAALAAAADAHRAWWVRGQHGKAHALRRQHRMCLSSQAGPD
jgi:hypothetical protein